MGLYTRQDSKYYWFRLDGTNVRISTKILVEAPTDQQRRENRKLAELAYHAAITDAARERFDLPGVKASTTFRAFVPWYETHELPQHRGAEREREILPRLVEEFGSYELVRIRPDLVKEWITRRLKETRTVNGRTIGPPSPRTVNREIDVLKCVLQAAVPKYLEASPLFGMKQLQAQTPKRRLLTESEERRLLAVMTVDDRALFLIGLDALVRLGDILDLRRRDDGGDRLWIADPKAGGGFHAPISRRLRKALDALYRARDIEPDDHLFTRRRIAKTERDRRNGVRQMLERYCAMTTPPIPYGRKAGGLTFHWSTRRTGATRMINAGVDLGTAQKIGRWKTPSVVLGIYHELTDEASRAAVETVGLRKRDRNVTGTRPQTTHRRPTRYHAKRTK